MDENQKYQMEVLDKSMENIAKLIDIAEKGNVEMIEELKTLEDYLAELNEARKSFKEGSETVSIFEFALIKKDIDLNEAVIRNHKLKIDNINRMLEVKFKELDQLKTQKEMFIKSLRRGQLYQFKGKNG